VALILCPACAAGPPAATAGGPGADVAEASADRVAFSGGTLRVVAGECDTVDVAVIHEWAERARRDLSEAWPERASRFTVSDLTLRGERDPHVGGRPAHGYWLRATRTVVFRCGDERVIRHELFHVWCEDAGLPCDCTRIDHPEGFRLDCSPQAP